jgi:hypothetical protein
LFVASTSFAADAPKPKYGPQAITLSSDHGNLGVRPSPDFWALMPYYVGQQDERSCSVASVTMVINAARAVAGMKLTADDRLIEQATLLKKVGDEKWQSDVGTMGHGVTLDELGEFVGETFKAYGFPDAKVTVVHAADTSKKIADELHRALIENERSAHDFIIANFIQGAYTGDADVGHISPIAAYDAAKKRVLVLDSDREWYEPYWVSEKTFLEGMATKDPSNSKTRGYVWVKF